MKINEVIQREGDYETGDKNKQLANLGRTLMDMSAKMKMTDDASIELSNKMSRLGDELTAYGTAFGARTPQELEKKAGMDMKMIQKFLQLAQKQLAKAGPVKTGSEPEPEDEPEDDFDGPSDDEIARQADKRARGK